MHMFNSLAGHLQALSPIHIRSSLYSYVMMCDTFTNITIFPLVLKVCSGGACATTYSTLFNA